MINCTIKLDLVNQNGTDVYEAGDCVDLVINLTVRNPIRCEHIGVRTFWRTRGRGDIDTGESTDYFISGHDFEPGEYEFKKTILVQPGPATFHGYYINLDWFVEVSLHGPTGAVFQEEQNFLVQESSNPDPIRSTRQVFDGVKTRDRGPFPTAKFLLFLFASFFFCLTLVAAFFGFLKFALVPGFFFSSLLVFFFKRKPEKDPFRNFIFDTNTPIMHSGQEIDVGVSFLPDVSVSIHEAVLILIGYEVVTKRAPILSKRNDTIQTRESFRQDFRLSGPFQSVKNHLNRMQKTIVIPPNLPASFNLPNNELRWELSVIMRSELGHKNIDLEIVIV